VIGDDKGLPASITGLFVTAYTLYVRRFVLYGSLAFLAFAVQLVVDLEVIQDTGLATGLEIIVDAFVLAAVSIGVAFDVARKDADWSTIFNAASLRWGVLAILGIVTWLFSSQLLWPSMFLSADQTGYGLLLVPIVVLLGALAMAQVVAAIDPVKSRLTLPFVALAKGILVSLQFVNLGRLMLFSVLLTLPVFVAKPLADYLLAHHYADAGFWAIVPLDAITLGPLQALATVFYIDFLRRAKR
jgi:hypothetical protein